MVRVREVRTQPVSIPASSTTRISREAGNYQGHPVQKASKKGNSVATQFHSTKTQQRKIQTQKSKNVFQGITSGATGLVKKGIKVVENTAKKVAKPIKEDASKIGREIKNGIEIASKIAHKAVKYAEQTAKRLIPPQRIIVNTGAGDNVVSVSQTKDGYLKVTVDGKTTTYSPEQARNLEIRTGGGNDRVVVDPNVTYNLTIKGGAGDDKLIGGSGRDRIYGGTGRDYIRGGRGDDRISGGAGKDVIYGMDGKDSISGGKGQDYIDGGRGNDFIRGGRGDDAIFGGEGRDVLLGGSGKDMLAGGKDRDVIRGGTGRDRIYAQRDDIVRKVPFLDRKDTVTYVDLTTTNAAGNEPGSTIRINGSPEFQARVQSDIEALRSVPEGRAMLIALDNSPHSVTIQQAAPYEGNSASGNSGGIYLDNAGNPGGGSDVVIRYNPERVVLGGGTGWQTRPPIVGLYHEMVHAYNMKTGTLQQGNDNISGSPNYELQAIGLPNSGIPYDHDKNPNTPNATGNPFPLTENDFRRLLGLPLRTEY